MPTNEKNTKIEPIQAVERALMILELISRNGNMSLNDLHKEIGVNKASLLRLAYTLVDCGYLNKNETNGNYSLTLKPYEIGLSAIHNLDKMSLVTSTLADLYSLTGRIAQFSIEDNNQVLCLQSIGQRESLFSVYTNQGGRSPMYCTSAGKALLSAYSNTELITKWEKLGVQQLTEHTITDIHEFLQDISQTRQRGYALDKEENEYNVYCIGSIVMGASNTPVGAISLSGKQMSLEEQQHVGQILLQATQRLSSLMGYIAPMKTIF